MDNLRVGGSDMKRYRKITLKNLRELEAQLNEEMRRWTVALSRGFVTDNEYTQAAIIRTGKRQALRHMANKIKKSR